MKKLMFALLITLFAAAGANAQDYSTGIGLRGGWGTGLTIKHFLKPKAAVEGIFDSRWHGLSVTGLYELHTRAFDVDRLNFYYGIGGHIGFWDGKYYRDLNTTTNYTVIGIDGILGLEYNFKEIPFNLSIDWKPAFDLTGYSGFYGDGGAISIRYIF
jgi:hypothetical protein